ncbi:hypothetical protein B0H13DRAFT_2302081 [Mycena leptocephala]|nr:hypothetical protein B0H13DRAFT_2302075 [Mycena leptocephala]KAJ7937987.1 hypothetical protein B0H13DRAFT_2302081 [Mycena leptocephala]
MTKRKKSTGNTSQSSASVVSRAASVVSSIASKAKGAAKKLRSGISSLTRSKSSSSQGPIEISDDEDLDDKGKERKKFDRLKANWTAPIYSFFKPPTLEFDHNDRPYHMFRCASTTCQFDSKGVKRFADTSDSTGTSNLKKHARKCFGEATVDAALQGAKLDTHDSSIHAAFGHQNSKPNPPQTVR